MQNGQPSATTLPTNLPLTNPALFTSCHPNRYLQNTARVARDLYADSSAVNSVAVVPLMQGDDMPIGALYCCPSVAAEFTAVRECIIVSG